LKYIAVYVWTHAGLCRALRRQVRLHLYSDLNRNPYRLPYATLNRASLQKPFVKPNAALFHWLYGLKYRWLYGLVYLVPYREI
jgi:hypothetical protein